LLCGFSELCVDRRGELPSRHSTQKPQNAQNHVGSGFTPSLHFRLRAKRYGVTTTKLGERSRVGEARRRGAKKLLLIFRRKAPRETWPARTTVRDLMKRHDLIPKTRRQPRLSHPGRPLTPMTEPNGIWTADFKGQFKTRDGIVVTANKLLPMSPD
jgi:hypothetical protein